MLCFKNYTFGSKNCNHQDQLETFETCLFIVQFQLALFLLKPVGMPMSDKTVQPKNCTKGACPFSIFIGTKMPFESWYDRGMGCEHVNIFIFPCWAEFIWSHWRTFTGRPSVKKDKTYSCLTYWNPSLAFIWDRDRQQAKHTLKGSRASLAQRN